MPSADGSHRGKAQRGQARSNFGVRDTYYPEGAIREPPSAERQAATVASAVADAAVER